MCTDVLERNAKFKREIQLSNKPAFIRLVPFLRAAQFPVVRDSEREKSCPAGAKQLRHKV